MPVQAVVLLAIIRIASLRSQIHVSVQLSMRRPFNGPDYNALPSFLGRDVHPGSSGVNGHGVLSTTSPGKQHARALEIASAVSQA